MYLPQITTLNLTTTDVEGDNSFINSMNSYIIDSYIKKDYSTIRSASETADVQEDLYSMSEWPETWELRLNAKKSVHIGNSNPRTGTL